MKFKQQIVFMFILIAHLGKSFSLAHDCQVKEAIMVKNEKELAMEVVVSTSNFSLQKEIVPKVETSAARIGGRKMRPKRKSRKVSTKFAVVAAAVGKRKLTDEEDKYLKDNSNVMAFSADYRSPKPHPPKNN